MAIALAAGIFFGSDVTGVIYFDNSMLAKQIADLCLVFVLFIGGFGTRKDVLKAVFWPSIALSTIGVALTAGITGFLLHAVLGYGLYHALLLGCIISSTDAAAVFSILRFPMTNPRLQMLTKTESATNDPMAIVLTMVMVSLIGDKMQHPFEVSTALFWQFASGIGIGLLIGFAGCYIFERIRSLDRGYLYLFTIGIVLLSYGAADMVMGSGMLSAFFAGYVMGNSKVLHRRAAVSAFFEALSAIANAAIFVILGLLVFPREFGVIWVQGLALFVIITFIARPVAVLLCTAFSNFSIIEKVFVSWSGLRGAVPIVLATYPVAAGIEAGRDIFNIIFFAVVLSLLFQGITINRAAQRLGLADASAPAPEDL